MPILNTEVPTWAFILEKFKLKPKFMQDVILFLRFWHIDD